MTCRLAIGLGNASSEFIIIIIIIIIYLLKSTEQEDAHTGIFLELPNWGGVRT